MVSKQTVTLANSIVGVSVLAMPFCFKQCGIILATLMLMLGAVITRMVCYFLLKAGTITRRRNYEMLAWHTFGTGGKFIVEISIIGFLIGTLIAFFVVMGDLGPQIVSDIFDVENNYSLRNIIMAALSLFVALPLGLLRNIDSLSSVSTASVLFYVFLVFKILSEGLGPLFSGSYLDTIDFWRPAGVLQCIPIFSMALSCQTQIFGIYESLPDPSLQKMNEVVKQAVNICTVFYFCIGFFGYIAFCHQSFGGNILMTLSRSWTTQLIKACFLMSIVFSVPLVVFPCRASLHSLIFRRVHMHHSLHDITTNYIPDGRLKFLTILIIAFTLVVGILIPNIELVLGLVGSTTGSVICIIFPSIMFIRVTSKQTTERLLAQVIFCAGVVIMVVSTYATLYAVEQSQIQAQVEVDDPLKLPDAPRVTEILKDIKNQEANNAKDIVLKSDVNFVGLDPDSRKSEALKPLLAGVSSKAPEIPKHAHDDKEVNVIEVEDKEKVKMKDNSEIRANAAPDKNSDLKSIPDNQKDQGLKPDLVKSPDNPQLESQAVPQVQEESGAKKVDIPAPIPQKIDGQPAEKSAPIPVPAVDGRDKEKVPIVEKDAAVQLLKKLEEHEENQKKFLEEQRKILAELKEHHEQDVQQLQKEDIKEKEQSDNLINAVAQPDQKIPKKDDTIVEVQQQEKLIEKLSENIEKEKENAKIMEKIEAGLEKEIDKNKAESSDIKNKVNLPQPIPPENSPQLPIVVGDTVGRILDKVDKVPVQPDPSNRIADPVIVVQQKPSPIPPQQQAQPKRVLKPIPIQNSEDLAPKDTQMKKVVAAEDSINKPKIKEEVVKKIIKKVDEELKGVKRLEETKPNKSPGIKNGDQPVAKQVDRDI